MAVAAKLRPSPPPPAARRTVARLACTHVAWAAADAVICLFIASMWLLFWGQATKEVGLLACGERCAVVAAAYTVASAAAGVLVVLVLPFVLLLLMALMMARAQAAAATDIEATKEAAQETPYDAVGDTLCGSFVLGLLALMAFTRLMLIGLLLKAGTPVMGARRERMGSVIYEVGVLGRYALDCFGLCPFITVTIWRCWMKARRAQ